MPAARTPIDDPGGPFASTPAGALLLAEFIHRTANDFAVACAEVQYASRLPTLSAVQGRLSTVVTRLHALASIQRALQPPRQASIDLGNALCDLCHHHAEARFAERGAFIRLHTCEAAVDAHRGWALLMIVSELLTNAARHAFEEPGGLVQIDIAKSGDTILCQITDNGIGMRPNAGKRKAGTVIVEELAQSAQIAFRAHPVGVGTLFELKMPCSTESVAATATVS